METELTAVLKKLEIRDYELEVITQQFNKKVSELKAVKHQLKIKD